MAVARSRVFPAWRVQNPGCATRRRRSATVMLRASTVVHGGVEAVAGLVAADLPHALAEDGIEFDPVAVPVDDRVIEMRSDVRRRAMPVPAQVPSLNAPGERLVAAWLVTLVYLGR